MRIAVVTDPAAEPITRQNVYNWLRMDTTGSPPTHPLDDEIDIAIAAARDGVERDTRRSLVARTYDLYVPNFCAELVRPPLISVQSIRYYDDANALQTLDSSIYFVTQDLVPKIALQDGQSWPITFQRKDAVIIRYIAGFEGTGSPADLTDRIPAPLKQACLVHVQMHLDYMKPADMQALRDAYDRLVSTWEVPLV